MLTFTFSIVIRNKSFQLLEMLKSKMSMIMLTLQIRIQALDLQDTRAFVLLLPILVSTLCFLYKLADFKLSIMGDVLQCLLGIASV